MDAGQTTGVRARRISWRSAGPWLLGVVVLSGIVLGPWGLLAYVAGFLESATLMMLFMLAGLVSWAALLCLACAQSVRSLRARHQTAAVFWSSVGFGVVLAIALYMMGKTPVAIAWFAHGVLRRLEIRTDIDAVQAWVESLNPSDCRGDPHSGGRGRHLREGEQPQVLKQQNGMVDLELDAGGKPRVRLSWDESKAGMWGLVIGHRDTKTPPSDPNMYGEKRSELRPGIYFWYEEG